MTQHGDHIMRWISLAGGAAFAAVIAVFVIAAVADRRRERQREAEAAATLLPPVADVVERTIEQIALDGTTDEERKDAVRDARLDAWLADVDGYRRRDAATMDQYTAALSDICARYQRNKLSAYDDGALAMEGFGFPIQRDRARMSALYERAHTASAILALAARPLATTVDATETFEWPQEWLEELDSLLTEAVPA